MKILILTLREIQFFQRIFLVHTPYILTTKQGSICRFGIRSHVLLRYTTLLALRITGDRPLLFKKRIRWVNPQMIHNNSAPNSHTH